MSFADVASRLKEKKAAQEAEALANKPPANPAEVLRIRQRITGVLIRDARLAKGYTAEQVAALLHLNLDELMAWEFGQSAPSLPQLELLAYWLEVPVSHFISGTTTLLGQVENRHLNQTEYQKIRDRMIGVEITTARKQADFTLAYLAERLNISPELLQAYEFGQIPIPLPILSDIASALRITINYFFEGSDRVGAFIQAEELFKTFLSMKPEVREFVAQPSNHSYIAIAMKLAEMDAAKLRQLAEMLLDVTL